MNEYIEKIKSISLRTDTTRQKHGKNDDRYWRQREDPIRECMGEMPDGVYERAFGYSYKINGRYYRENGEDVTEEVLRGKEKENN